MLHNYFNFTEMIKMLFQNWKSRIKKHDSIIESIANDHFEAVETAL